MVKSGFRCLESLVLGRHRQLSCSWAFLCLTMKMFKCEKPREELFFKTLKSDAFDVGGMYLNGRKKLKVILVYFNLSQHLLKGRSSSWSVSFGPLPAPAWFMRANAGFSSLSDSWSVMVSADFYHSSAHPFKAFVLFWSCLIHLTIAYFRGNYTWNSLLVIFIIIKCPVCSMHTVVSLCWFNNLPWF